MGDVERVVVDSFDTAPRPLAEKLDIELAKAAMKKYETKQKPEGWLHSAWSNAELDLNSVTEGAEEYFKTSQILVAMILKDGRSHQDTQMKALTLSTYMPLFEKRVSDDEVTSGDCERVYESLGWAMQYLRPLTIDEPPQWRMTEVAVLALSARSRQPQLLLYPTSPREETSLIQELNHDSYFFKGVDKIPLQQKLLPVDKAYDSWVNILTLQPMINRALKARGATHLTELSDKVNYLFSLIVAETSDAPMTREEVRFLNVMTEAVAAHFYSAADPHSTNVAA